MLPNCLLCRVFHLSSQSLQVLHSAPLCSQAPVLPVQMHCAPHKFLLDSCVLFYRLSQSHLMLFLQLCMTCKIPLCSSPRHIPAHSGVPILQVRSGQMSTVMRFLPLGVLQANLLLLSQRYFLCLLIPLQFDLSPSHRLHRFLLNKSLHKQAVLLFPHFLFLLSDFSAHSLMQSHHL